MATILFISETGMPHCAFRVNGIDWYGFKPDISKSPVAHGHVDRTDRSALIKSSVTLTVSDHLVAVYVPLIVQQYGQQYYVVGIHDCVSFAADVAERLELVIPRRPNFLPGNFIDGLRRLNANLVIG